MIALPNAVLIWRGGKALRLKIGNHAVQSAPEEALEPAAVTEKPNRSGTQRIIKTDKQPSILGSR